MFIVEKKNSDQQYRGYFERIQRKDLPHMKKPPWGFTWRYELSNPHREVYKLLVEGSNDIQAGISFEYHEGFILVEVIESAPYNRNDTSGLKVAPTLFAFASKTSFDKGFDGYVAIHIKRGNQKLIKLYLDLGASHLSNDRLVLDTFASRQLINIYYR
ncbi:hypothetical protein [Anaerobacillus sp. 1_MG-2023]|uniref:hypothetical protein n=1 Tax=Anaerobacillus sp. 1_MG-2023 TaxID=3062655 RepID=UPI0026E3550C|nr:hypothetical protein [Anaerobacillus sp. 1_MG-2023]MDO6658651.1 hypothetical protein [Anaerobacillus sp. 1_MG-2023]